MRSRLPKVALIISDLGSGGAQRVLVTLAGVWAKGRNVTLITLGGTESDFYAVPNDVNRLALNQMSISNSAIEGLFANLKRIASLRSAIQESSAEVVISFVAETNVLTILASLGLGKTVVVSERNDPRLQQIGRPWQWLRSCCYRLADYVTANNRGALEVLRNYVPKTKLMFTPNPLLLRPAVQHDLNRQDLFFLAVGRLHYQKAHDVLLAGFARSRAREMGWRLVVLGEGSQRRELEELSQKLGINDLVDWRGEVQNPFPWYDAAGAFVLPSRHEGMPNALLEAMASGLPVIVTDASPGPLEFVEDGVTGFVIPVEDSDALAAKMDALMMDLDLASNLGSAGQFRVTNEIRLEKVLETWAPVVGMR